MIKIVSVDEEGTGIEKIRPKSLLDLLKVTTPQGAVNGLNIRLRALLGARYWMLAIATDAQVCPHTSGTAYNRSITEKPSGRIAGRPNPLKTLVTDPVLSEPLSGSFSLLYGKIQGKDHFLTLVFNVRRLALPEFLRFPS